MYFIKKTVQYEEVIKKSRFIAVIAPCGNQNEVITQLKQLYEAHPHASHIAFAYRLKTEQGIIYRFHDAGEPTGTAGKPIFQHLEGKQLINVLIAVIRYFGGVKLGAGGLTRAYGNSAKLAIESSELFDYIEFSTVHLTLDYAQLAQFEYQLKKWDGTILQQAFDAQVRLILRLPTDNFGQLKALFPLIEDN